MVTHSVRRATEIGEKKEIRRNTDESETKAFARTMFHDPVSTYFIALRLYPGDPYAIRVAQWHIIIDNICSREPEFRKTLEAMAILSSRKKRRRKKRS